MKILLTIPFLFVTFFCSGQIESNSDALYNIEIPYRPAIITILTDTGMIRSSINKGNISRITHTGMEPGQYKLRIEGQGQQTIIKDNIVVKQGQNLVLSFTFEGPCLYDHPANYTPICPKNHTDSIIPIVYGLMIARGDTFIKNKKDMKVKYAGCVTTGCDPQFYCKEHDMEF